MSRNVKAALCDVPFVFIATGTYHAMGFGWVASLGLALLLGWAINTMIRSRR